MMNEFVWGLKNGDLDQVREFVEKKLVNVNVEIDGRQPLHYAADYGQKEIIQYLVDQGANLDSTDKHGISPLLAAIWEGHTDCVRYMLTKGASKKGSTPDGTSYMEAAEKPEIRDLLK